jgi:CRISPR-associated protein (TIGR02710 family)
MDSHDGKPKAVILSVGGAAAPIVASLNAQQPALVCFFVSPESRPRIKEEILDKLAYQPAHHDWIETPSAEDLLACYRTLVRELPRLADKWKVPLAAFVADYTGGTKTMSVALALATLQDVGRYTYVGGTERTKDGLGIVVDGKERMLHQTNPWDALAIPARQRASLLFARGRYEAAADEFRSVADRVSAGEKAVYQGLEALARGYAEWDRFAHKRAQDFLFRSLTALDPFAVGVGDETWSRLVEVVRRHAGLLRDIAGDDGGLSRVMDLIANARRRGDLEARYDDAVARLYSALEMTARMRLAAGHGIVTSNVRPEQIPEALRPDFWPRYMVMEGEKRGNLRLPLHAAYRLLVELKDELATRFLVCEKEIGALLDSRNKSILAHGGQPVSEDLFRRFLRLVLEVVGLREEDLPEFPRLPW